MTKNTKQGIFCFARMQKTLKRQLFGSFQQKWSNTIPYVSELPGYNNREEAFFKDNWFWISSLVNIERPRLSLKNFSNPSWLAVPCSTKRLRIFIPPSLLWQKFQNLFQLWVKGKDMWAGYQDTWHLGFDFNFPCKTSTVSNLNQVSTILLIVLHIPLLTILT